MSDKPPLASGILNAPLPQLVEGSRVARLIAQAVEQEREACLQICREHGAITAASAIMARGSAA